MHIYLSIYVCVYVFICICWYVHRQIDTPENLLYLFFGSLYHPKIFTHKAIFPLAIVLPKLLVHFPFIRRLHPYAGYIFQNKDAKNTLLDIYVNVLRQDYWPSHFLTELKLPSSMVKSQQVFADFYKKKHNNRKLVVSDCVKSEYYLAVSSY